MTTTLNTEPRFHAARLWASLFTSQVLTLVLALGMQNSANADTWLIGLDSEVNSGPNAVPTWEHGGAQVTPYIRAEFERKEARIVQSTNSAAAIPSQRSSAAGELTLATLWLNVANWGEDQQWQLYVGAGIGEQTQIQDSALAATVVAQAGVSLRYQPSKQWNIELAYTDIRAGDTRSLADGALTLDHSWQEQALMLRFEFALDAGHWRPTKASPLRALLNSRDAIACSTNFTKSSCPVAVDSSISDGEFSGRSS